MKKREKCRVFWQHRQFGWDAVAFTRDGRSINKLNYGLSRPPSASQRAEAEQMLCPKGYRW